MYLRLSLYNCVEHCQYRKIITDWSYIDQILILKLSNKPDDIIYLHCDGIGFINYDHCEDLDYAKFNDNKRVIYNNFFNWIVANDIQMKISIIDRYLYMKIQEEESLLVKLKWNL